MCKDKKDQDFTRELETCYFVLLCYVVVVFGFLSQAALSISINLDVSSLHPLRPCHFFP